MKKNLFILFCAVFCSVTGASAQSVLQSESFESRTIFPSPGWRNQRVGSSLNASFSAIDAVQATNPAPGSSPAGGNRIMRLNTGATAVNDSAAIITKPYDFSNNGGADPFLKFYMYRDNGKPGSNDRIEIYINTSPTLNGATLLSNNLGTTVIPRYNNSAPVAAANTWNQYTYQLPAAQFTGLRYYFIILGISGNGNDIYLDQFQVNTYPSPANVTDVEMDLFLQNPNPLGTNTTHQWIAGIRCVVAGNSGCGVINTSTPGLTTAIKLDSLLLNTNGTSALGDIANARIYYTGGSPLFDTSYVSPFPITGTAASYPTRQFGSAIAVPATNLNFANNASTCFYLEYDTTYFWLTYDIKPTAVQGNFVDADFRGAAIGGNSTTCPSNAGTSSTLEPGDNGFSIAGGVLIDLPYCSSPYTSGTSWWNGSYTGNDYIQSVTLVGASGTAINTNIQGGMPVTQPSNNNTGLPQNLPCLLVNGGSGCDFTAFPSSYELWPAVLARTAALNQGTAYTVTVQAGTRASGNNIAVFIDYNRDGDFSDAGEKLSQVNLLANAFAAINFTVPANSFTGITRMRVREVWSVSNIDPCAQYDFGETEDFFVAITPNCVSATQKLWLGITDDWNNAINWCGGVPQFSDNAVIDRAQAFPPAGVPTRPYFPPVIKSQVAAFVNTLNVSNLDTLMINASTPAPVSLKVRGDITINGRFEVKSEQKSDIVMGNGTLNNILITPFKSNATDARTQIIYSRAELLAMGFQTGDRITGLQFNIISKGSTAPYANFTIGFAQLGANASFTNNVPKTNALTTVFGPTSFTTLQGANTILFNTPIIWNGTGSIMLQICFNGNNTIGPNADEMFQTQTTGFSSILCLSTSNAALTGCTLVPGAGVSDNFFNTNKTFRPNFTLMLDRPYGKVNMVFQEDWVNNGSFAPGVSRVTLDSSKSQLLGGSQISFFNELQVSKVSATQTVTLQRPVVIDSTLLLTQGLLQINGQTLTMNRGDVSGGTLNAPGGPFTRTNGFLISESATSSVIWKNLNVAGYRVIPFGNATTSTVYIPYTLNLLSGSLDNINVSTYNAPGNAPLPPGVAHFNPATGAGNNAAAAVDRFWVVGKTGTNPVADLTFRFTNTERPAGMGALNPGRLQPYKDLGTLQGWLRMLTPFTSVNYGQSYGVSGSVDSVRISSFNWPSLPAGSPPQGYPAQSIGDVHPWTITLNNTPCGFTAGLPYQAVVSSVTNPTCPGATNGAIDITVTGGTAPYTYLWNNGATTQDRTGLGAGTYTVTVTDGTGTTRSVSATLTVSGSVPSTPGTISGAATGVCNGSIAYSVPAVSGVTYIWSAPAGGTIISGQGTSNVQILFNQSFVSGTVSVSASNACGNSSPRTKTVNGKPSRPAVITGPTSLCTKDTVFYTTPSIFGATVFTWTVPSGMSIVSGQGSNTVGVRTGNNPVTNGNLCVKSGNNCGTTSTYCITISSTAAPASISSVSGPANGVCNSTRTYSIPAQASMTYNWTVPAGATISSGQGTNSINVAFSNSFGTGNITATVTSSCGASVSKSKSVKGLPATPASITGSTTPCANGQNVAYSCPSVTGATTYTWTVPSGTTIVSGQGTRNLVVSFNNTAGTSNTIKVKAGNSCGTSANRSLTITWQSCPRIGEDVESEVQLYPNPANEETIIRWSNETEQGISLTVINSLGQQIWNKTQEYGSGQQQETINTSMYADGLYFVSLVKADGTRETLRLVVSR